MGARWKCHSDSNSLPENQITWFHAPRLQSLGNAGGSGSGGGGASQIKRQNPFLSQVDLKLEGPTPSHTHFTPSHNRFSVNFK